MKTFARSAVFFCILVLILFNQLVSAQEDTIPHILQSGIPAVIDGQIDELWNAVESHDITYMINGTNYPSTEDCSGYFKAVWMSDSLYLLIRSTDDIIGTSSGNPWENDGFEVYFDMDNSKDTVYQEDNYQFRFNLNSDDITGEDGPDSYNPPDVDFEIASYPEHYSILEVVFPLVELGMVPEISGKYLGFDVQILDNDGHGREVAMAWNNNEHEAYFNPSKMGTVLISEEMIPLALEPNSFSHNLYPNPANTYIIFESNARIEFASILSPDGRLIQKIIADPHINQTIDVSMLKKGLYFLVLNIQSGQKEIFTFVKE
jgi:hypothetical protein